MKRVSGHALEDLKNSALAAPLRMRKWRQAALKEQASVRALAENLGLTELGPLSGSLLPNRTPADVMYIFGNGASVNALTESDFEEIGMGASIGTNAWPLHPFVPDIFSFEFSRHSLSPDPELEWLVGRAERKILLRQERALLFLRPGLPAGAGAMVPLSLAGKEQAFLYGRANLFSSNLRALDSDLKQLMRAVASGSLNPLALPDNGSSVVRMIFLSLILGFRKIVLTGVDLNNSPYFWFDSTFIERHGDFTSQSPRNSSDALLTEDTSSRPFETSLLITRLAQMARKILGASTLVASESSALAAVLPVHEFKKR